MMGKGTDDKKIANLDEGTSYDMKAGVLGSDGNIKALIREGEMDEIKELPKITLKQQDIFDAVSAIQITQIPDHLKGKRDLIHLTKCTVGDVNKFREKPGAFLKVFDESLEGNAELMEKIRGFSILVEDDQIVGPGTRMLVLCRSYQKMLKGTQTPDGFPSGEMLDAQFIVKVPYQMAAPKAAPAKTVEVDDGDL
jgi:hypothetical protein